MDWRQKLLCDAALEEHSTDNKSIHIILVDPWTFARPVAIIF
jgi:hypothetical protein